MNFTADEIALARELKANGLQWEPRVGHYVYDELAYCQQTSPFQEQVYFILNYGYFMKAIGGVDRFKEIMIWLPTWYDCRQILEGLNVDATELAESLEAANALAKGTERIILYQLISKRLSKKVAVLSEHS